MPPLMNTTPAFFSSGVTTACFVAAGTVEDASDEFTIRVSTGASRLTLDFSRAPVRMSVRGDSLLPVDKHNLPISATVASSYPRSDSVTIQQSLSFDRGGSGWVCVVT